MVECGRRGGAVWAIIGLVMVWSVMGGGLPVVWAGEGGAGGVSDGDLPAHLKDLFIQDRFIPCRAFKEVGVIHRIEGRVIVVHRASGQAYFGKAGDPLYENDGLHTLSGARCRIRLHGDDVVRMGEETSFSIDSVTHDPKTRKKSSFFSMLKGKAMFYTLRLLGYGRTNCTVKTPTAVAGVRGTKFGVHVYGEGDGPYGRLGARVAAAGPLAQLGGGPGGIITDVFSLDGLVDVNGQPVPPGTLFQGLTGRVVPLPPGFVGAFEQGLGGTPPQPPGGGAGGEPGPGGGAGGAAAGAGSSLAALVDTVQEQGGDEVLQGCLPSEEPGCVDGLSGIAAGKAGDPFGGIALIVGMQSVFGSVWVDSGLFVGQGNEAYSVGYDGDPNYRLLLESGRVEDLTFQNIMGMTAGEDLADHASIAPKEVFDYFKGGEYTDADGESYMEWGWWEDPGAASPIGAYGAPDYKYYALSQKIWQIQGTRTHPDYLDYLQTQGAVYTYSGETKGVIACDGGIFAPAEVSGTFSCDIDFGSRALSQFKIDATGPAGYEVHLSGSGSVSAEGNLDLDTLGGTIKGGSCPTENTLDSLTGAQGAVLGKQADGVGGYWHAAGDQGYALGAGEFHAER